MRTCQLDGCENSLELKRSHAKYCCYAHCWKAWHQSPEAKARRQSPEKKAYKKAYSKAYQQTLVGKASLARANKKYAQTPKGKAAQTRYKQSPEYKKSHRVHAQQRIARKAALPATFTAKDWNNCLEYFDHRCVYCGETGDLYQEHFIPLTLDGPYTPDNIVPACSGCNKNKFNHKPEDWCTPEQYERVVGYLLKHA